MPAASAENLWGVGFYNRQSRDAFIALWLEHAAEGFGGLKHGGVPMLHYDGHGQLWSRYPAEHAALEAGTSIQQKNAYVILPYDAHDFATKVERLRHQLLNPLEAQPVELPRAAAAGGNGGLANFGETKQTAPLKPAIWDALRDVRVNSFTRSTPTSWTWAISATSARTTASSRFS